MNRERVAVVGGGYMGVGIAQTFALAGHAVRLVDVDEERTRSAVDRACAQLAAWDAEGLVDAGAAGSLITGAASIENAVGGAAYVTEAVPEEPSLKQRVLAAIAEAAPEAVIATNTSAIPLDSLWEGVRGRDRLLAAHWFNPAPFVPLVELAGGSAQATECAESILRGIGKSTVRVPAVAGFIANRLQFALYREAVLVVEEGLADPQTVDAVVTGSFGMRLPFFGPLLVGDIAGLDVYAAAFASLEAEYGARFAVPTSVAARVAAGDRGVKTGGGLRQVPSAESAAIAELRDRAFVAVRQLRDALADSAHSGVLARTSSVGG